MRGALSFVICVLMGQSVFGDDSFARQVAVARAEFWTLANAGKFPSNPEEQQQLIQEVVDTIVPVERNIKRAAPDLRDALLQENKNPQALDKASQTRDSYDNLVMLAHIINGNRLLKKLASLSSTLKEKLNRHDIEVDSDALDDFRLRTFITNALKQDMSRFAKANSSERNKLGEMLAMEVKSFDSTIATQMLAPGVLTDHIGKADEIKTRIKAAGLTAGNR